MFYSRSDREAATQAFEIRKPMIREPMIRELIIRGPTARELMAREAMRGEHMRREPSTREPTGTVGNQREPTGTDRNQQHKRSQQEPIGTNSKNIKANCFIMFRALWTQHFEFRFRHNDKQFKAINNPLVSYTKVVGSQQPHKRLGIRQSSNWQCEAIPKTLIDILFRTGSPHS